VQDRRRLQPVSPSASVHVNIPSPSIYWFIGSLAKTRFATRLIITEQRSIARDIARETPMAVKLIIAEKPSVANDIARKGFTSAREKRPWQ
jgi:hypothetical protein